MFRSVLIPVDFTDKNVDAVALAARLVDEDARRWAPTTRSPSPAVAQSSSTATKGNEKVLLTGLKRPGCR